MARQKFTGPNQLIDRLASQVGDRDLAVALLQKRGHLKPGTMEFTAEGAKRNAMTAEQRALDRAASASGRPVRDYRYNPSTNRATLRPRFKG